MAEETRVAGENHQPVAGHNLIYKDMGNVSKPVKTIVCTYVSIAHFLLSNINFYCTVHVYVVSHFYYCNSHFMWKRICEWFFYCLFIYMYCPFVCLLLSEKQLSRGVGIPLTCLILTHFCACPSTGPGLPMPHLVFLCSIV